MQCASSQTLRFCGCTVYTSTVYPFYYNCTSRKVLEAICVVLHVLHAAPFNHFSIAIATTYCSLCGKMNAIASTIHIATRTYVFMLMLMHHIIQKPSARTRTSFTLDTLGTGGFVIVLLLCAIADDRERSISTSHVCQLQKIFLLCLTMAAKRKTMFAIGAYTAHRAQCTRLTIKPYSNKFPRIVDLCVLFSLLLLLTRARIKWVACLRTRTPHWRTMQEQDISYPRRYI